MPTINTATAVAVYVQWANDVYAAQCLMDDDSTADHLQIEAHSHWTALMGLNTPMRSLLYNVVRAAVPEEYDFVDGWVYDLASGFRPESGLPYILAEFETPINGKIVGVTVIIDETGNMSRVTCDPMEAAWYFTITDAFAHRPDERGV